jgi:hypothetical protein
LQRQNSLGPHVAVQREPSSREDVHPAAEDIVRDVLHSPGRPLDAKARETLEPRFGYDFSQVRVHANDRASESARAVHADAYTAGRHVVFGEGRYSPGTPVGQRLLAHELTHVVQQASGPVFGTEVTKGLAISHPGDRFERAASEASVRPAPPKGQVQQSLPSAASTERPLVLQRQPPDPSVVAAQQSASAAQGSLIAGSITGGLQALGGLASAFEAIRQANFAERQAQAAEDPPVAEPTTGGMSFTPVEVPEVKGVTISKEKVVKEKTGEEESTTTIPASTVTGTKTETTEDEPQKKGQPKKSTTTGSTTTEIPEQKTTSHVDKFSVKGADQPDQESEPPFTVLRLAEGKTGSQADFVFTLRYNGTDVRGGTVDDPDYVGYLGGTNNSNAAVTFRASPGKHLADGTATVRLLFGGSNVPPRKTAGLGTGFLGLGAGGTELNKDYVVQHFKASVRFSGKGEVLDRTVTATPRDRSTVDYGDGKTKPLISVGLDMSAGQQPQSAVGVAEAKSLPPEKAQPPGPPAPSESGGGGGGTK